MRALAGQPTRPYGTDWCNAGATRRLQITALNFDDELFVPTTARYRIDNLTAAQVVLDWTAIAPLLSIMEVLVTSAQTTVIFPSNDSELLQITVEITNASGDLEQQLIMLTIVNTSQMRVTP